MVTKRKGRRGEPKGEESVLIKEEIGRRLGWKAAQPNHDSKMLKVNSGVTVSHWGLELFLQKCCAWPCPRHVRVPWPGMEPVP